MAPTITCIRHGQGLHNIPPGHYDLPDPRLTPLGEQQCRTVRDSSFPDQSNISLVTASPLCRTLHSATVIFNSALTSNGKCRPSILALPDAQETSDDPCDVGTDPEVLAEVADKAGWPVDLSLLKPGWNDKSLGSRYSPHSDAIAARARSARIFLRSKLREVVRQGDADAQIVLVTHGSFCHFFTDDWEDADQFPATGWRNCESRSYVFECGLGVDGEGEGDEMARLTETGESRERRGKTGLMLGRERQPELFRRAMESWGAQGLQRPDRVGEDDVMGSGGSSSVEKSPVLGAGT